MKRSAQSCSAARLLVAATLTFGISNARADSPPPVVREIKAARVSAGRIFIDGVDDEPAWKTATYADDFVQLYPTAGAAPTERTRAAVLYDDLALYVFLRAFDSHADGITGLLTRRDEESPSDVLQVLLDPHNDRLTGYLFSVNASGVQVDARYSRGGEEKDSAWNAVWSSAVTRSPGGWSAEIRIPFEQLRYDSDAPSWGIQFIRRLQRRNELSVFSPVPPGTDRTLSHMGRLLGIRALPPATNATLLPYSALGFKRDAEDSFDFHLGGDARVGLGSAATLQFTVNPDFAQVEQDPSVLNLTAFETFVKERRPFFVDGQETLAFSLIERDTNTIQDRLYHSRRIGATPGVDLGLSDDQVLQNPQTTTIVGAAKLAGRTANGLGYSGLTAQTAHARALTRVDGVRASPIVASPTNYTVLRVRQEIGENGSHIGAIGTSVLRNLDAPLLDSNLARQAATLGFDFDLRSGDYAVAGNAIGSYLSGSRQGIDSIQRSSRHYLQRPDAHQAHYDPKATTLEGYGLGLVAGKLGGTHWRASIGGQLRSPTLELNDMGYMRRADSQLGFVRAQWRRDVPGSSYRVLTVETWGVIERTFGSEETERSAGLSSFIALTNDWYAWGGVTRRAEALDVTLLRGGPAFRRPGAFGTWVGFSSDDRKPLYAGLGVNGELADEDSYRWIQLQLNLTFRLASTLSIGIGPTFARTVNDLQYVDAVQNGTSVRTILGRLDQQVLSMSLRSDWTILPGLTLQVYAMPFVAAGHYLQFYAPADSLATAYAARRTPTLDYGGADRFSNLQLRSSFVLRWEYLPGSPLFLTWTHDQSGQPTGDGYLDLRQNLPDLFRATPVDTVLLKCTYRVAL